MVDEHQKAGAQISARAFWQSALILLFLMLAAGLLTRVIPAGEYTRTMADGRELILPNSFSFVEQPDYPVWRWLTAPVEVLWGPDAPTVIVIIIFLLMVGSAFAALDRSGILTAAIGRLVQAYGHRKYILLLVISFFFMLLGAFFGIFEEIVPLIPLMVALAYMLGWDALVGLGMSILATNMGFSAAITNPFTIGVAQRLAQLPLFSGAWLRIFIFAAIYLVLALFLVRYARRIERDPTASPVYLLDAALRARYRGQSATAVLLNDNQLALRPATRWLLASVGLIVLILLLSPLLPLLADIALPLIGLIFLVGGLGAAVRTGVGRAAVGRATVEGLVGIAPSIPLILMAVSVKHIVATGGILDTLLHGAAFAFGNAGPFASAVMIYFLALGIEFFVASGSAKAFLLMPILVPLGDLVGVTRQVVVTAYCFGDGFSNLAYPTNPVLLISLGLTVVGYPTWIRWTAKLWLWILLVTLFFLWLGVTIDYGPF
jgi:uncharacterized ion transporter superfamily protein YfcC